MSPLEAWLYLDRMDLARYWPENAPVAWDDFYTQFTESKSSLEDNSFLTPDLVKAYTIALNPKTYLPSIPSIDVPQPIGPDLYPLNEPDENSLVIVTGNSQLTFDVMATIWAQGVTPAYLLLVDCLGSTVDMAMVYKNFTPDRLQQAIKKSGLEKTVAHRLMIVPGLTSPLADEFKSVTGWEIEVGPVCAAEIPLFLGDRWIFPDLT
ncbi:MAG: hypothetical protein HOC20_01740 [Chloroflexi bacterium]|jgi:CO dehydrogenase/acetyl-CoA synthase gamma subunit (corrinoid Fe-S protein)|nr:hypothetical protein [Chloroflexota bacterium]